MTFSKCKSLIGNKKNYSVPDGIQSVTNRSKATFVTKENSYIS
jgi:hypothetical protein